jgi:hypothetical protein
MRGSGRRPRGKLAPVGSRRTRQAAGGRRLRCNHRIWHHYIAAPAFRGKFRPFAGLPQHQSQQHRSFSLLCLARPCDGCPKPSRLNFQDSDVSPSLARRASLPVCERIGIAIIDGGTVLLGRSRLAAKQRDGPGLPAGHQGVAQQCKEIGVVRKRVPCAVGTSF